MNRFSELNRTNPEAARALAEVQTFSDPAPENPASLFIVSIHALT